MNCNFLANYYSGVNPRHHALLQGGDLTFSETEVTTMIASIAEKFQKTLVDVEKDVLVLDKYDPKVDFYTQARLASTVDDECFLSEFKLIIVPLQRVSADAKRDLDVVHPPSVRGGSTTGDPPAPAPSSATSATATPPASTPSTEAAPTRYFQSEWMGPVALDSDGSRPDPKMYDPRY